MDENKENPILSIVVPVYNEEGNLQALYARLKEILDNSSISFEIIFVDDGSSDRSLEVISQIAKVDNRVRYSSFSRNFGHEAASSCGFGMAKGKAAVLMDADLQDPPEIIPEMFSKWREGFEVVNARRVSREGESFFKRLTSYLFYRIMNLFGEIEIPADVGDFRLVDRKVIDSFNQLGERNRFVRGLFNWVGFKKTTFDYRRPFRKSGITKYNIHRLILLSIDALFSFSLTPLRLCIIFGIGTILLSFSIALIVALQRLFWGLDLQGYALLATGMFFLGGVQLIFMGVIGEYVGKIYREVQARPLYIVKESSDTIKLV
jgi:polyisoprenyl-phosphate glycosyltransferase